MPAFDYFSPAKLRNSVYGCVTPSENFRLKSLLLLVGIGRVGRIGAVAPKKLEIDFMLIPHQAVATSSIMQAVSKFPTYTRKQLDDFFRTANFKNPVIHRNICNELKNVFGYQSEKNHIGCFLHIYRIVEQIALCLPIVSIIKKGGFNNTFSEFKGLIEGGAKSDLAVLKKYSRYHLDGSVANSVAKLSFSRTGNPQQNIGVVKRYIKAEDIVSETVDSIEIKYMHIDALIIGFRNQFFHYLFHEKNLSIMDLECPDEFLEVCNPIFINYFAFLFHELLESELMIWGG
ncbi:hypothetical protein ACQKP7_19150 [Pseudomonas frederiksbergensis]|uniref:hypothetical protein n=1 Tax=Pseudomonas frederiksbergensis TaxID=104087 RepID=UPI003D017059